MDEWTKLWTHPHWCDGYLMAERAPIPPYQRRTEMKIFCLANNCYIRKIVEFEMSTVQLIENHFFFCWSTLLSNSCCLRDNIHCAWFTCVKRRSLKNRIGAMISLYFGAFFAISLDFVWSRTMVESKRSIRNNNMAKMKLFWLPLQVAGLEILYSIWFGLIVCIEWNRYVSILWICVTNELVNSKKPQIYWFYGNARWPGITNFS